MQVCAMTNNVGIEINADVNVNNWLLETAVVIGFFRILVYVNVINCEILENI